MLENPLLVPQSNRFPSSRRVNESSAHPQSDMTLDTDLLLPAKKRRETLPLKKRYHVESGNEHQLVDANCNVESFRLVRKKAEKHIDDLKLVRAESSSPEDLLLPDTPMDFSLPNRIRAVFQFEPKSVDDDCKPLIISEQKRTGYMCQSGIFGANCSPMVRPLSFGALPMSLQAGLSIPSLLSTGLSPATLNLHFPMNFTSMPLPNLIPRPLPKAKSTPTKDVAVTNAVVTSSPKKSKCKPTVSDSDYQCAAPSTTSDSEQSYVINPATGNRVRRCYKNMTTERRMEANARERTRVHTIGAAFEQVRKLVPALAPDQKLSKLSILRIACSYIMLLAAMNDLDYSADTQGYTVEECAEMLTETINCEAKFKR